MSIDIGDVVYEGLQLWPGYQTLHEDLLSTDPRTSDPRDLAGPIRYFTPLRAACLLYASHIGGTLAESAAIVGTLLAMCEAGRRPRFLAELGITAEDILG